MKVTITTTHAELNSALARVAPAMSKETSRYSLQGICLDYSAGQLLAVATDGHRLHNVRMNATVEGEAEFQAIIPASLVNHVLKVKPTKTGIIDVAVLTIDEQRVSVSILKQGQTLSADLVDGTYPTWRRVVPSRENAMLGSFSLKYLEAVVKAAQAGGATNITLAVLPTDSGCIHDAVATHDEKGGEYVLMPKRVDTAIPQGRAIAEAA